MDSLGDFEKKSNTCFASTDWVKRLAVRNVLAYTWGKITFGEAANERTNT
jgi:hypothetical protein